MLMLAGIVHSVDLGHAVGQVTEESRPDLGVDTFAGGQEPGDFIHAFTESGTIFPQHSRVCVQRSCTENRNVNLTHTHCYIEMTKTYDLKRTVQDRLLRNITLTGHLSPLEVPEMLHSHL